MISPKEILKGSILCHEGKAKIVKAIGDYILFENVKEWIGGSMVNGEPISEVWLERFGFQKTDDGGYFNQFDISNWGILVKREFSDSDGWITFQGFISKWSELKRIEYVHQLQMLCFVISDKHLTIPKLK